MKPHVAADEMFPEGAYMDLEESGSSSGLLMDLASNEKHVHAASIYEYKEHVWKRNEQHENWHSLSDYPFRFHWETYDSQVHASLFKYHDSTIPNLYNTLPGIGNLLSTTLAYFYNDFGDIFDDGNELP